MSKKATAKDQRMARRWGVTQKTVFNWRKAAGVAGVECPMDSENPDDFLEWYRATIGRDPSAKLKTAARRIMRETGQGVELLTEVEINRAPIEVLERVLEMLGKGATLARVLEEEETAGAIYQAARKEGQASAVLRKNWSDAAAMAQSARKGEDAVLAAVEILKELMRREIEPAERLRRQALSGGEIGAEMRAELMAATTSIEWEKIWDKGIEKALRDLRVEI